MDLFQDFPNLHPMFVHFPIVLLLLAALVQLIVLFKAQYKELKWLVLFFLVSGFLGSLVAILTASHISGDAEPEAFEIFDIHYLLGYSILWLSLIVSVIRFIAIKWYNRKWTEYGIMALLGLISILVAITGHLGAQMVYIYDIGPQGNGVL